MVIKLIYLQIKHPQSIFEKILTLVLNSKTKLLDSMSVRRLLQTREPQKWTTFAP